MAKTERNPLISIIMPAYNSEKYIEYAIESVINQNYLDWELLIIDDKSKDNTLSIINRYSELDNRIKSFPNEVNLGVSETRNKAISMANGEWVAFLDSDDLWKPEKLKKQMDLAIEKNAEFVFTGSAFINEEGTSLKGIFQVPEVVDYKKLRNQNIISCSSVLIKKSFFENIKMEKDEIAEDYAVWLKVLKTAGVKAYGINEPLLVYRISRNSKSGNKIKAIKMVYGVFRFVGLTPAESVYFTIRHLIGASLKYIRIMRK